MCIMLRFHAGSTSHTLGSDLSYRFVSWYLQKAFHYNLLCNHSFIHHPYVHHYALESVLHALFQYSPLSTFWNWSFILDPNINHCPCFGTSRPYLSWEVHQYLCSSSSPLISITIRMFIPILHAGSYYSPLSMFWDQSSNLNPKIHHCLCFGRSFLCLIMISVSVLSAKRLVLHIVTWRQKARIVESEQHHRDIHC
jgi:hypothetical protein